MHRSDLAALNRPKLPQIPFGVDTLAGWARAMRVPCETRNKSAPSMDCSTSSPSHADRWRCKGHDGIRGSANRSGVGSATRPRPRAGKWQLTLWSENPYAPSVRRIVGGKHKHGLGIVELSGNGQQRFSGQCIGPKNHGQRVAGERSRGEYVSRDIAESRWPEYGGVEK